MENCYICSTEKENLLIKFFTNVFSLQCSFLPRFSIKIRTKYYNDNGGVENVCISRAFAHFIFHTSEKEKANNYNGLTRNV